MGTDIHPYVEVKVEKTGWKRAYLTLESGRNYMSFAILANVRNGFDFAGVPTHEPVIPISEPKGLPKDTSIKDSENSQTWDDPDYIWLGDHSHSWLTLKELKSFDLNQFIAESGVVSGQEQIAKVKAGHRPDMWCGDKHPMTKDDLRMEWQVPIAQGAWLLKSWIDDLTKFVERHYGRLSDEDVRVVFGFDS